MRIFVKARPGAREERVEKIDATHFLVSVREPPENGLANLVIRKVLADHLGISAARLTLKSGFSSRQKVFLVE